MYLQNIAVVCLATVCLAQGPGSGYLPPKQGYDYPRPSIPFPNPTPGLPPAPTTTSYRPPPTYTTRPNYSGTSLSPDSLPGPGSTPFPSPDYTGVPTRPRPGTNRPDVFVGPEDHLKQPHVPGMPFDFNYAVKDDYYGTDFSHNAISDGDQVKGEYRVQLPDGRVQIVSYVADWATGYHANVRYEGEARYPETQGSATQPGGQYPKPSTSYGPPQTSGPY